MIRESYREVDSEDMSELEKVQIIDDILDDPELKEIMLERIENK